MHVLYCEKITVAEYQLAIWSNKDTLYYNNLPEKEVVRFISLWVICWEVESWNGRGQLS